MLFLGSYAYFVVCLESERVRADFLAANATAHKVTATTATTTKMRYPLLNCGGVGLGETGTVEVGDGLGRADVVGLGDADGREESDITEILLVSEWITNISPLLES